MADRRDYVERMQIERLTSSINPYERAQGAAILGLRKQAQDMEIAREHNRLTARGQDAVLQGHMIDNNTRVAQLRNDMRKQNADSILKHIENIYGPAVTKGAVGGEAVNTDRRGFEDALSRTLGENNFSIGDLSPKDLTDFKQAYDMAKNADPGTASKLYRQWIDGRPWVKDYNPHRQVSRATGPGGQTHNGWYRNANGALVYEPSAVNGSWVYGDYDANAARYLNQR